jgi:phage terminase large subunit GpA-like protein
MRLDDYDGAAAIAAAWADGLRPDPSLTVSAWADRHRVLSPRGANEAGPWRTSRTPYLKEIMDHLSPSHPCQRVVFMKGAQTGGSEAGNNFLGYVIHHAPGPILAVQPTVELAKRFSQQRVEPLIEASPMLRERVAPARSRDSGNTVLAKTFPGGILVLTGANSAVGLRSMPARYLFLDEVDAYPPSADEEGDPVALAEARTRTFAWRRKVFLVSTPTIRGSSRIEREYEASDQRRFFVGCPHCGHRQWLSFERLRWEKHRPETAAYHCEGCEKPIEERHKTAMLAGGEWRATATSADPLTVGFHISSLYSPLGWLSWERIAREWLAAQGSDEAIRSFKNGVLGETWMETGEAPDWQQVHDRRVSWPAGTVPQRALFLTAGADVQKDRIEVDVWAWGRGLESWLIDHLVIEGGPGSARSWAALDALLGRTWEHDSGVLLPLMRLAIDTGYEAPAVYAWARRAGFAQVAPVKWVEGFNRASPVSGPTFVDATDGGRRLKRGARLWTIAVSTFKAETYRFLRLDRTTDEERVAGANMPAGTVHLPGWIDSEWVKQLVAEQLVTVKTKRGFQKLEWQKLRDRNEALDCRVYARAAAWIAGADRWSERKWAEMERELGVRAATPTTTATSSDGLPQRETAERPADRHQGRGRSDWLGGRQRNWFAR